MKLCDITKCTGCSACVNVCPKKAITLQYNERGFLYPIIDNQKCINCGLCTKLCKQLNTHMNSKEHKEAFYKAYAVKIKNDANRMKSQSGGLFTALAETILKNKGIVYGAGFDNHHHVKHIRIDDIKKLDKLKGSKYVQSDINNSFEHILNDLRKGKKVLFSGTPCQVAGIESLLDFKKINKDNFYSCDLICHGVPSPKVYEKYISLLENDNKSVIKYFIFRDKSINGWKNHVESYIFQSKPDSKIVSRTYGDLFYSNLTLRKSCERCKYATRNRPGDITMADCWGIEKINPNLWNDNKGISVCLIQTKHGEKLFKQTKSKVDVFEIDSSEYTQHNLNHSSNTPYRKEKFWKDYQNISFKKLMKKYTIYGGITFKLKRKIFRLLKKW